jgi:hypothetical protein
MSSSGKAALAHIIGGLASAPEGKEIAKAVFAWSGGNIDTITYKDANDTTLFVLTFNWSGGVLQDIVRTAS